MRRIVIGQAVLVASLCGGVSVGQVLKTRPPQDSRQVAPEPGKKPAPKEAGNPAAAEAVMVPMSVPTGTPIKVALDSEVRIRKVGQAIHGKTTEPVYAFDKLLIPVGTPVNGIVSAIDPVPKMLRTMQATNGNFSPVRAVHVQFDELVMNDGHRVILQTVASPAPDGVLRFVSANEKAEQKSKLQQETTSKVGAARQAIHQQWSDLQKQIHQPGKIHKLKRIALAELPVHPQYIDAGTSFNAELQRPLDFGSEAVKLEALINIGAPPPTGSVVHARLETGLSSATARKGDPVEAVITEPLVVSDHLILPEGSVIKGSVVQVAQARRLGRNGRLRILFHQVAPPNGIDQKVETNLEGVAVAKGEHHLKLDAEGGAPGHNAAHEISHYRHSGNVGGIASVSGSRRRAGWAERRRNRRRRGQWGLGIQVGRNGCGNCRELARSVSGLCLVWGRDVDLLSLPGARARCRLSQRHGYADWTGNTRRQKTSPHLSF